MDTRNEYRIVKDGFSGFEAQFRRVRKTIFGREKWGSWEQCGSEGDVGVNTRRSVEEAEKFARDHADWPNRQSVEKKLGRLP